MADSDLLNPNYVDGSFSVNYCPSCQLSFRPDLRIWPSASTHCPKDGAPLRSWIDIVREANGESRLPVTEHEEVW